MNVNEVIHGRRAVRSYTPQRVDESTVRSLLRAAVQAPSAMNAQPWLFSIVQDVGQLARWSERAKAMLLEHASSDPKLSHYADILANRTFNIFYNASTLIVIGAKEQSTFIAADCWLAAENLMLAACDIGLGTCCIGFAIPVLNTPEAKTTLGLPSDGVAIAAMTVGYPTTPPAPVPRKEPQIAAWLRSCSD